MRNNWLRYDKLSDVVRMTRVDGAPLDFLGWSACEAAVGNDRAGLGLPGVQFERSHASDSAVSGGSRMRQAGELMIDLYRRIQPPGISKAEAFAKDQNQASK
jgi:CHAT domain-containing protein